MTNRTTAQRSQAAIGIALMCVALLPLIAMPIAVACVALTCWCAVRRSRPAHPSLFAMAAAAMLVGVLLWSATTHENLLILYTAAQVQLLWSLLSAKQAGAAAGSHRLADVLPLSLGLGPSIALAIAWAIGLLGRDAREISESAAARALSGVHHPDGGIALGYDLSTAEQVALTPAESAGHFFVAGGTGSGKTSLLRVMLEATIPRERTANVLIVGKDGGEVRQSVLRLDPNADVWHPAGDRRLALFHGSATEFSDKLVAAQLYTEPHYRALAVSYALRVGRFLELSGCARTAEAIASLLHPRQLADAARGLAHESPSDNRDELLRIALYASEIALDRDERRAINGLRHRFAELVEGDTRRAIGDGPGAIQLLDTLRLGRTLYVELPSERYPRQVPTIASWLMLELIRCQAILREQRGRIRAVVYFEEIRALQEGARELPSVLALGRDAGITLVLSTQQVSALRAISMTLPEDIGQNTSNQILLRHWGDDAAWGERLLGLRTDVEVVQQIDGNRSRHTVREVRVPVVGRERLEQLGPGDAVARIAGTSLGQPPRYIDFRVAQPTCASMSDREADDWFRARSAA